MDDVKARINSYLKAVVETEIPLDEELFKLVEILCKMRYWQKDWKETRKNDSKAGRLRWEEKADNWIEEHVKEIKNDDDKDVVYCAHFGCGRKLTLTEKICGNKCINHCIEDRIIF